MSEENLTLSQPPPLHHRARRLLPLSERALVGWLRVQLKTVGGEALVRKFGARAVLDTLYDGLLVRVELARGGRAWVLPNSSPIRNPGGYLRWLLEAELGR